MKGYQRTLELLKQLISSKQNLASTLVDKGEEASIDEPFDDLVEKAGNYVPKTMIFVDEDGNETVGVIVSEETIFDATVNDVREGKVFATEHGVKTGEKVIPSYITTEGFAVFFPGERMELPFPGKRELYEYSKLQAIICPFNKSIMDSVAAEKVSINDNVYNVQSVESVSKVLPNPGSKTIDLGIVNDSNNDYVVHYFTFKEIY